MIDFKSVIAYTPKATGGRNKAEGAYQKELMGAIAHNSKRLKKFG